MGPSNWRAKRQETHFPILPSQLLHPSFPALRCSMFQFTHVWARNYFSHRMFPTLSLLKQALGLSAGNVDSVIRFATHIVGPGFYSATNQSSLWTSELKTQSPDDDNTLAAPANTSLGLEAFLSWWSIQGSRSSDNPPRGERSLVREQKSEASEQWSGPVLYRCLSPSLEQPSPQTVEDQRHWTPHIAINKTASPEGQGLALPQSWIPGSSSYLRKHRATVSWWREFCEWLVSDFTPLNRLRCQVWFRKISKCTFRFGNIKITASLFASGTEQKVHSIALFFWSKGSSPPSRCTALCMWKPLLPLCSAGSQPDKAETQAEAASSSKAL